MEELFIKASRSKLRFEGTKNLNMTVEDLWDLPLASLDAVAKAVNKKIKDSNEESFITEKSTSDFTLELKLEIVKYVIKTKLQEADDKAKLNEKKQEIANLKELLSQKKSDNVKALSIDEIQKRLNELQA